MAGVRGPGDCFWNDVSTLVNTHLLCDEGSVSERHDFELDTLTLFLLLVSVWVRLAVLDVFLRGFMCTGSIFVLSDKLMCFV